jgi:drug/metabolite transporter (DMT)-like permease
MKRYLANRGLPPLVLAASQLTAASLLLAALTPLFAPPLLALTPAVLASVVALGAAGTGAAYSLNYRLIQDKGSITASTVTYLLPVVAVVLGIMVLSERITWNLLLGTVIVLAGVAISEGRLPIPTQPTAGQPYP